MSSSLHRLPRNATQPSPGRDVEAWCVPCGMALTHTIIAMVGLQIAKVRCNTCKAEHKYKSAREAAAPAAAAKTPGERKPKRPATEKVQKITDSLQPDRAVKALYARAMAERDRALATPYLATLQPKPGQLIEHKVFGVGIVDAVFEGKSRFLFENGYKVLVTGR